jgi:hypothetical protein
LLRLSCVLQRSHRQHTPPSGSPGMDWPVEQQEAEESGAGKETEQDQDMCAICLDREYPIVRMPCCDRQSSSMKYCRRCLEILCLQSQFGAARCPTCRTLIGWNNGTLERREINGQCRMCCQQKVLIDQGMCDACLYGNAHPLRYECNRCHSVQTIAHPMWRYQAAVDAFSGASWACHVGCGDYTHWRVIAEDVSKIPPHDIPETWGVQNHVIEAIRAARQAERG